MGMTGVEDFIVVQHAGILLLDKVFRGYGCRAKFIIKLATGLLEIKFNTKKTRCTQCFSSFIDRFNMPAQRTFPFVDAEYGLK